MVVPRALAQLLIVKRRAAVVRMGDEAQLAAFAHAADHVLRVARRALVPVALDVDARCAVVQVLNVPLGQGEIAALEHVDLAAVQHAHAEELPRHGAQVVEVDWVAGAGNARRVLCDAQNPQTPFRSRLRVFANGAVRVAAGQRVRVKVRNQPDHVCRLSFFILGYSFSR